MMRSAVELLRELNSVDESPGIEAKRASEVGKSLLETVIAFANEPGLGGGYLLLGVERVSGTDKTHYQAVGIPDPDKLQADLATQCAATLNIPLRPQMRVDHADGKTVLVVYVPEAATVDKPVYLKATGLPRGAFRRIGSTDQRCTDDDLWSLRQIDEPQPGFDAKVVDDCTIDELDPAAIAEYRRLRALVNPQAEELAYPDEELLEALLAARRIKGELKPTVAGVLLFGKPLTLRRLFPTAEVSYVRVVGTEWVADPERRFAATLDVRKAALLAFRQIAAAIEDDLPKGFYLPPDSHQSLQEPLVPRKAFREALANAIIHRSYRFNQPTIVVRYSDRIEFINTGYSLKPVSELGRTGPAQRNPILASIFRDVEIAEAKGSGIRTIRRVCEEYGCPPPEFISNRQAGTFTTILRLPVIEEHAAKGAKTAQAPSPAAGAGKLKPSNSSLEASNLDLEASKSGVQKITQASLLEALPQSIRQAVERTLGTRQSAEQLQEAILLVCSSRPFRLDELEALFGRHRKYLTAKHLRPMLRDGRLALRYPDTPNHPDQAYQLPKKGDGKRG
jgi:ATP-dependent DNA helicase RecG